MTKAKTKTPAAKKPAARAKSKSAPKTTSKPLTAAKAKPGSGKHVAAKANGQKVASPKASSPKAAKPASAKSVKAPAPGPLPKPAAKAAAKPAVKPAAKTAPASSAKAGPVKTSPVKASPAAAVKAAVKPAPEARKVAAKPAPAPAKPAAATKPAAAPQTPAPKAIVAAVVAPPPAPRKLMFKINELVVYPAHGVGRVSQIEEQEIAGAKLELYIVDFEKEKLRLKVPTSRAEQKGMRRLSDKAQIEAALKVLRGRARIKRTMWSRRAQEYDAKINSGDIMAVAEVVRDLFRSERQPEQSYSERQLFEQALDRMAREIAAVKRVDDDQAVKELEEFLARNAKRAPTGEKAEGEDIASDEAA